MESWGHCKVNMLKNDKLCPGHYFCLWHTEKMKSKPSKESSSQPRIVTE